MKHLIWIMVLSVALIACTPKETQAPTELPTSSPTDNITPIISVTSTLVPPTLTATSTLVPTKTKIVKEVEKEITPSADYPEEGYGPVKFPDNINPLTGLPVEDPAILDRRPVAIKVSNYPREIRPQWGLSYADLVFEYYHEGGLTRFHAIYYGNDANEVGPLRSARFADEHLIRAYKSVFAFGSADYRVRWMLYNSDFFNRLASVTDKPCPSDTTYPTCRIDPGGWNHLMTDTSILSQHFSEKGVLNDRQYLDGLHFNQQIPENGQVGTSVTIRYSSDDYHKWEYDPISGHYLRNHDVAPESDEGESYDFLVDRSTNQTITAENIVVLLAPYSFYSREPEIIEINLVGFGKAYLFRDGQAYAVNWARINENEIISLTYEDGSRVPMKPGSTWFDIIGQTSPIITESPDWRFQFQTP